MNVSSLASLFGDIPPDSEAGKAIGQFVGILIADAKHGGAVGNAFRAVVDAGRKTDDSIYRHVSPLDKATALNTLNALKGVLDA